MMKFKVHGVECVFDVESLEFHCEEDAVLELQINQSLEPVKQTMSGAVPNPHKELFYFAVDYWTAVNVEDDEPMLWEASEDEAGVVY
jgi:hypothetical protein